MSQNIVTEALTKSATFEVVESSGTEFQLRLIGRITQKQLIYKWLSVLKQLDLAAGAASWTADLSKKYNVRGDRLFYAWRLIFQSEDNIENHYKDIARVIRQAPQPVSREVTEIALPGASANRNMPKRGKGAQNPLRAVVGPAAKR
jgi:hypothetical protein